jgi:hypothetical protein
MADKIRLPVVPAAGEARHLGRREVLQGLMGTVGASFAIPAVANAHPVQQHLKDHERVAAADALATADARPEFLDAHQMETFTSLAERIVPGSTKAKVAPFVDQLLAVDTREHQMDFVGALGALEGESIRRYAHPWKALTESQQVELLTAVSTAPAREERYWRPGQPAVAPPAGPPPPPTLRDRFDELKGWVMGAYYSSEIGMRELGWTGTLFFPSFPGCEHPGGHRG